MRHIFQVCFNTYKTDGESNLSDLLAHKYLKFSPRLFEIKLSHRMETVSYIEDTNMFVVSEGEAARCYNFHTGESLSTQVLQLSHRWVTKHPGATTFT